MSELLDLIKKNLNEGLTTEEQLEYVASFGDREAFELFAETVDEKILTEFLVKTVSSRGEVRKIKDRKTRQRQALQTTGLSRSKRRQIARKAAKTKRSKPTISKKASRKRARAMKRRKSMGL